MTFMHNSSAPWTVEFLQEFEPEFDVLDEAVQDELLARAKLLEQFGPSLGGRGLIPSKVHDTRTSRSCDSMQRMACGA